MYSSPEQLKEREQFHSERVELFKTEPKLKDIQYPIYNMRLKDVDEQAEKQMFAEEYQKMEEKYQISKYHELPICVISLHFNNAKDFRVENHMNSIFTQNYSNYMVVFADHGSNDGTKDLIQNYLKFYNIKGDKAAYYFYHYMFKEGSILLDSIDSCKST